LFTGFGGMFGRRFRLGPSLMRSIQKGAKSMHTLFMKTPHYLLLEGKTRIQPSVVPEHSGPGYHVFYAFSDKPQYDLFQVNSNRALVPYPLVSRFLMECISMSVDEEQLLVIDAVAPNDAVVHAATMKSVLSCLGSRAEHVGISFRLTKQNGDDAYTITKSQDSEHVQ
jgi:hypothetical protein